MSAHLKKPEQLAQCATCPRWTEGWRMSRSGKCPTCATAQARDSIVSSFTRYEDDVQAMIFVRDHPDGAELWMIGEYLGLTCERIRQIEYEALAKMRRTCERMGISKDDLARILSRDDSGEGDH